MPSTTIHASFHSYISCCSTLSLSLSLAGSCNQSLPLSSCGKALTTFWQQFSDVFNFDLLGFAIITTHIQQGVRASELAYQAESSRERELSSAHVCFFERFSSENGKGSARWSGRRGSSIDFCYSLEAASSYHLVCGVAWCGKLVLKLWWKILLVDCNCCIFRMCSRLARAARVKQWIVRTEAAEKRRIFPTARVCVCVRVSNIAIKKIVAAAVGDKFSSAQRKSSQQ